MTSHHRPRLDREGLVRIAVVVINAAASRTEETPQVPLGTGTGSVHRHVGRASYWSGFHRRAPQGGLAMHMISVSAASSTELAIAALAAAPVLASVIIRIVLCVLHRVRDAQGPGRPLRRTSSQAWPHFGRTAWLSAGYPVRAQRARCQTRRGRQPGDRSRLGTARASRSCAGAVGNPCRRPRKLTRGLSRRVQRTPGISADDFGH